MPSPTTKCQVFISKILLFIWSFSGSVYYYPYDDPDKVTDESNSAALLRTQAAPDNKVKKKKKNQPNLDSEMLLTPSSHS